jgi:hypothetical protein
MFQRIAALILIGVLTACAAAPPAPPPATPASPPPVAAAPPPTPAPAAEVPQLTSRPIVIATLRCESLLSAAEDDRAAASMFYLGYAAARTNTAVIDVSEIEGIEKHALDYCLAHPAAPARIAYSIALAPAGHRRHWY